MATMKDLPYDLLYHIIFLLVQSPGGEEGFARITAVCRDFLLYAADESILRAVNFNIKMEPANFYRFQNVNGLLVKCSEAGNVAAQHVLGKVILLSATHLFLSEQKQIKFSVSPFDRPELNHWLLDTNVPARNNKVRSFMTYFSPIHVYTGESSPTRLVHYQLVKMFLLNGSHHDFVEMGVFLKYCIKYLMRVARENSPLLSSIEFLLIDACRVRSWEKLVNSKETFDDCIRGVRELLEVKDEDLDIYFEDFYSAGNENSDEMEYLLNLYSWKCATVGVDRQEALSDVNFVEALRADMSNQLKKAYSEFGIIRAETVGKFECEFGNNC